MRSTNCYIVSKPQIVREQFDEEVVIVDLDTGSYYSLSGAGGEVWNAVENGANESQIVERLAAAYDGEQAEIADCVTRLLQELQREELIAERPAAENNQAAAPTETESETGTRLAWEAPILQKFTDMQALLLLDPIHEVDSAGWPMPKPEEPVMTPQNKS